MKCLSALPDAQNISKFHCPKCDSEVLENHRIGISMKSCQSCRAEKSITHGKSNTRMYNIWCGIKKRCDTPSTINFHIYGGKGVTYSDRWKSFENFQEDMGSTYFDGAEIDRIDSNGNYGPSNCRWLTKAENVARDLLKPVLQLTLSGQVIKEWSGGTVAERHLGMVDGSVTQAIAKSGTAGGFKWDRNLDCKGREFAEPELRTYLTTKNI